MRVTALLTIALCGIALWRCSFPPLGHLMFRESVRQDQAFSALPPPFGRLLFGDGL
jgi:hypothetical protein